MSSPSAVVTLLIMPSEDDWTPVRVQLPLSITVGAATRQIAQTQWRGLIKNPEAYSLAMPPSEEQDKIKRKQLKKKLKVGAFRDDTVWLDSNHPLAFYKLKNEVGPSLTVFALHSDFFHYSILNLLVFFLFSMKDLSASRAV